MGVRLPPLSDDRRNVWHAKPSISTRELRRCRRRRKIVGISPSVKLMQQGVPQGMVQEAIAARAIGHIMASHATKLDLDEIAEKIGATKQQVLFVLSEPRFQDDIKAAFRATILGVLGTGIAQMGRLIESEDTTDSNKIAATRALSAVYKVIAEVGPKHDESHGREEFLRRLEEIKPATQTPDGVYHLARKAQERERREEAKEAATDRRKPSGRRS